MDKKTDHPHKRDENYAKCVVEHIIQLNKFVMLAYKTTDATTHLAALKYIKENKDYQYDGRLPCKILSINQLDYSSRIMITGSEGRPSYEITCPISLLVPRNFQIYIQRPTREEAYMRWQSRRKRLTEWGVLMPDKASKVFSKRVEEIIKKTI
jgi:hypothetical protein